MVKTASKYCNRCGCKMEEHELFSSRYWRCMVCEPTTSTPEVEEDEEKTPEIWAPLFDLFDRREIEQYQKGSFCFNFTRGLVHVYDDDKWTGSTIDGVTYTLDELKKAWSAWETWKRSNGVFNGVFTI